MSSTVDGRRPATYEDLLAVPAHLVAEIVDGVLHTSPRPSPRHAVAASGLLADIAGPYDRGRGGPGGWWILGEPELHLGPDILVPDIAGWRRSRLPAIPAGAFFRLAPDWLCETLSPSTERLDRGAKLDAYARAGVSDLWLVSALTETIEAYRLERGHWVPVHTHRGDVEVRMAPFDAVGLELWRLWGRTAPRRRAARA
jgi:Uma2 family endonuclease